MRFYPTYKLDEVLHLPAVSFFVLLAEGLRIRHRQLLEEAAISLLPDMDKTARDGFLRRLELAGNAPGDMLETSISDNSDNDAEEAKLRKAFGQK